MEMIVVLNIDYFKIDLANLVRHGRDLNMSVRFSGFSGFSGNFKAELNAKIKKREMAALMQFLLRVNNKPL